MHTLVQCDVECVKEAKKKTRKLGEGNELVKTILQAIHKYCLNKDNAICVIYKEEYEETRKTLKKLLKNPTIKNLTQAAHTLRSLLSHHSDKELLEQLLKTVITGITSNPNIHTQVIDYKKCRPLKDNDEIVYCHALLLKRDKNNRKVTIVTKDRDFRYKQDSWRKRIMKKLKLPNTLSIIIKRI